MAEYPVIVMSGPEPELDIAATILFDSGCLGTVDTEKGRLAYFPESAPVDHLVTALRERFPNLVCEKAPPQPARDWLREWREAWVGFALGEAYFILPSWLSPPETPRHVLEIDPGQAFGTGTHESTALAVELLERLVRPGVSLLDVGAGTGILAMVAAKEGAGAVVALEPDPAACACARANVARNHLSETIAIECAGWEDWAALDADLVVANIGAEVLSRAVHRMRGTIVLSGLLVSNVEGFVSELPEDARVREQWSAGEWAALVIHRPRARPRPIA